MPCEGVQRHFQEEDDMDREGIEVVKEPMLGRDDVPAAWSICWSGAWVGALTAICVALLFGLAGTALGAHALGPGRGVTSWKDLSMAGAIFGVCGAFFSFAAGGWAAGSISGFRRSEPAMLHGAIAWLVAVPLLVALAALGSGGLFGAWYGGLAGMPPWLRPPDVISPEAALAARNAAMGAVLALLLGLVGAVIGGWMASGEPMTLTHYRTRVGASMLATRGRL
jgi:hypothetical protein